MFPEPISRPDLGIWGHSNTAPAVIAFAADYPERVRRLILTQPRVSPSDAGTRFAALASVSRADWRLHAEAIALLGNLRGDEIDRIADIFTTSWEPDDYHRWRDAGEEIDVSDRLSQIRCPTLLVPMADGEAEARIMTTAIPDARIVAGDPRRYHELVDTFLRDLLDHAPTRSSGPRATPALRCVRCP